jgi:hypothetical protein
MHAFYGFLGKEMEKCSEKFSEINVILDRLQMLGVKGETTWVRYKIHVSFLSVELI